MSLMPRTSTWRTGVLLQLFGSTWAPVEDDDFIRETNSQSFYLSGLWQAGYSADEVPWRLSRCGCGRRTAGTSTAGKPGVLSSGLVGTSTAPSVAEGTPRLQSSR